MRHVTRGEEYGERANRTKNYFRLHLSYFCGRRCLSVAYLIKQIIYAAVRTDWLGQLCSRIAQSRIYRMLQHSFAVSVLEAAITVGLAFILAYGLHYTNLPMFLPTLTYGFAVIYSLGKQGLITKLVGGQLFSIYGFWGLLISYVIYTLPPAFILLYNVFKYVDKHFIVVSQIMGDSPLKTFYITSVRPMMGTIAASFILSFFLSFTDFGIPASIGIWPM